MTDPDITEAIANLPNTGVIGVVAEYKQHVDGLPYRVVAVHTPKVGVHKSKALQYFATDREADRAAELVNQHIAAVARLTS